VSGPTPLLDFVKRGEAARDVKLLAAQGALAPRAYEQVAMLLALLDDGDEEIRETAKATLDRIPLEPLRAFLARSDVPAAMREFFAARGVAPGETAADSDRPLIDTDPQAAEESDGSDDDGSEDPEEAAAVKREGISQQIAKMNFSQRLKAAVKGNREMRAVLIRDPNKLIAASVLSSPKVTENEIAAFAKMANVSDEVLRIIGNNRAWTKNYNVVVGLTKNPKTPVAMSLNFLMRLNDRDLNMVSIDRNVPEPVRIAARKKLLASRT
jgi:hypothetical protein